MILTKGLPNFLQWDSVYCTGDPVIDSAHSYLLSSFSRIMEGCERVSLSRNHDYDLHGNLREWIGVLKFHCETEDVIFQREQPSMEVTMDHKNCHIRLLNQIGQYESELRTAQILASKTILSHFAHELLQHIKLEVELLMQLRNRKKS